MTNGQCTLQYVKIVKDHDGRQGNGQQSRSQVMSYFGSWGRTGSIDFVGELQGSLGNFLISVTPRKYVERAGNYIAVTRTI